MPRRSTRTRHRASSRSSRSSTSPGDGLGSGGAGQGSGFVISDEGEIVTNAHVITDAEDTGAADPSEINEAKEVYVEFGDRNQVPAEIIGFDPTPTSP